MLAISIKQPYAELIASGSKRAEYRSRPTNHRGALLVVASKSPANASGAHLPAGVAVCVVNVVGCRETADGYAWILENPRRVAPVAVKGSAAFYHVPDERIRYVEDAPAAPTASTEAKPKRKARPGPYSLHNSRGKTIEKGIRTPERARALASVHANRLGSYVRIHRDGFEVSGAYPG